MNNHVQEDQQFVNIAKIYTHSNNLQDMNKCVDLVQNHAQFAIVLLL
jgi:hypothetical protein